MAVSVNLTEFLNVAFITHLIASLVDVEVEDIPTFSFSPNFVMLADGASSLTFDVDFTVAADVARKAGGVQHLFAKYVVMAITA